MTPIRTAAAVLALLLSAPTLGADAEPPAGLADTFRWSVGRVAPWVPEARVAEVRAGIPLLQGRDIRFAKAAVDSPAPLACAPARYATLSVPAAGLFEGGLPEPAADAAALGLPADDIATVRITCPNAGYDVHRASDDQWLVALDDVIWTLDRSPGARALPDRPEHPVQLLLEAHFMGDMAFGRESGWRLIQRATPALAAALERALAATPPTDEPPPINGDPVTDSQEHPARFAVGGATIEDDRARVPVSLAEAARERHVVFVLLAGAGTWRIDDIAYEDGRTLRALLAEQADASVD
jgi:hypothetical protein